MFVIQFTLEAVDDLRELRKYEAQRIVDEIEMQLTFEPTAVTRNRKQLRSNQLAEWELR
jgi:mRNA-degrading endonuclease RelE of RelBE toxin-antitoxin system